MWKLRLDKTYLKMTSFGWETFALADDMGKPTSTEVERVHNGDLQLDPDADSGTKCECVELWATNEETDEDNFIGYLEIKEV